MNNPVQPVLTERGQQAITVLSTPGVVSVAEALALAVLLGEVAAPMNDEKEGA